MSQEPLFSSMPTLPIVPLPAPGEALGSWVSMIAQTYGLALAEYLERLGVPRHAVQVSVQRDLLFRPLPSVIRALQTDTGIAESLLRRMTFHGLDRDLEEACYRHHAPCLWCDEQAERRAGRSIHRLHERAVWRVVCPDHPPYPKPDEVEQDVPLTLFYVSVRAVIKFFDRAVYDPAALAKIIGPTIAKAITIGALVRFVYFLNDYIKVRLIGFDTIREEAMFRIVRVYDLDADGNPCPLPSDERNDPAISLILAWQLTIAPTRTLLTNIRTIHSFPDKTKLDTAQFKAFLHLLLEYWPAEILTPALTKPAMQPDWRDGTRTGLAFSITESWSNQPEYLDYLGEAHWNHVIWTRIVFSRAFIKRPYRHYSRFPNTGPFRYKQVAGNTNPAGCIALARDEAWERRVWGEKVGLRKFMTKPAKVPKRAYSTVFQLPPASSTLRHKAGTGLHIAKAVQIALAAYGPLPTRLRKRQRRVLIRKLSAIAIKYLNLDVWRNVEQRRR